MKRKRILVVDDEEKMRRLLQINLSNDYEVLLAGDGQEALNLLKENDIDLILTDLKMPKKDGIELLRDAKSINSNLPVVLMTAYGTVETAVTAMKEGAYDYVLKPVKMDEIEVTIEKALSYAGLTEENRALKRQLRDTYGTSSIITTDPQMKEILNLVNQIADTDATVLIQGESGTGKELIARTIHFQSNRCNRPLISISCGAIPAGLLESELFGHEKGAFTGAHKDKKGRFELADTGTLLLDEIGEMPRDLQVKILRVLEERKFMRVGGTREIEVDVRIIAATNKDLEKAVASGEFRKDLYYRLNVIPINLPPLRERKDDIPLLVSHFIHKHKDIVKGKVNNISEEAIEVLKDYHWPGNVRELENCIMHAMILTKDGTISADHLPEPLKRSLMTQKLPKDRRGLVQMKKVARQEAAGRIEKEFLVQALKRNRGNVSRSALEAGMNRRQFQALLRKHHICPSDYYSSQNVA